MNIGLLGSQNSHAGAYGKALNIDGRFPRWTISHIWGETPEHARERATEVQIPNVVAEPGEMIGKVDAIIIDTRDGANHLALARPFIGLGIPIFIDKPLTASTADGVALLDAAEAAGTPIHSQSVIPLQRAFQAFAAEMEQIAPLTHLTLAMPAGIDCEYSGLFFYAIHAVECLCTLFPSAPRRARVERFDGRPLVTLDYADGPLVTLNLQPSNYSYSAVAAGEKTSIAQKLELDSDFYASGIDAIMDFIITRKSRFTFERLLMPVIILDAMEASKDTGAWVPINPGVAVHKAWTDRLREQITGARDVDPNDWHEPKR